MNPIKSLWQTIVEKVRTAARLLTFVVLDITNSIGSVLDKFMPIILTPINQIVNWINKLVNIISSIFDVEGINIKPRSWEPMSGRAAMMRIGQTMLNNFILKNGVPDGLTAEQVMLAAVGDNSKFPEWTPPEVLFQNDGSIKGGYLQFETNLQNFLKWKKAQEKKKIAKKTGPAKNLNARLGEYDDSDKILKKLDTIDNNMRLTDEHEKLQQALNTLTEKYEDAATNEEKERLFRAIEKIVKGSGQFQDINFLEKIKPEERDDIIHKLKLHTSLSSDKFSKLEAMNQRINIEKQIRMHKYATLIFQERKLLDKTPQLHQRAKKNNDKTFEVYTVNNSYQSIAQIQSCLNRGINDTEHECNWIGIANQFDNIFSKAKSQLTSEGTQFNLHIWQDLILNARIPINLIKVFICNWSDYCTYLEGKDSADNKKLDYTDTAISDVASNLIVKGNDLQDILQRYKNTSGFQTINAQLEDTEFNLAFVPNNMGTQKKRIDELFKNNDDKSKKRFLILLLFNKALKDNLSSFSQIIKPDPKDPQKNSKKLKGFETIRNALVTVLSSVQSNLNVSLEYNSCYNNKHKMIQTNLKKYLFQFVKQTKNVSGREQEHNLQHISDNDFFKFMHIILEIINLLNMIINLLKIATTSSKGSKFDRDQDSAKNHYKQLTPALDTDRHEEAADAAIQVINEPGFETWRPEYKQKNIQEAIKEKLGSDYDKLNAQDQTKIREKMLDKLGSFKLNEKTPDKIKQLLGLNFDSKTNSWVHVSSDRQQLLNCYE